ncbi:hypothetical protein ACHAP5_009769 [Fusarium lateritium]
MPEPVGQPDQVVKMPDEFFTRQAAKQESLVNLCRKEMVIDPSIVEKSAVLASLTSTLPQNIDSMVSSAKKIYAAGNTLMANPETLMHRFEISSNNLYDIVSPLRSYNWISRECFKRIKAHVKGLKTNIKKYTFDLRRIQQSVAEHVVELPVT